MQTIATFFTGIMLFFSGLFGHPVQAPITQNVSVNSETLATQEIKQDISSSSPQVNISTTSQTIAPVIAKGFKGITEKLFGDQTMSAQYPENWKAYIIYGDMYFYDTARKNSDNKNKVQLVVSLVDDHYIKDGHVYVATSSPTFEIWVRDNFENNSVHLEKTSINGNEAWKVIDNSSKSNCANWWLLYHNGLVFLLAVTDDACGVNSKIVNAVINSIAFNDVDIDHGVFKPINWNRVVEGADHEDEEEYTDFSKKVLLIKDSVNRTIEGDFNGGIYHHVYTSNDKNKIYFTICPEREAPCSKLLYLNYKEKRYHQTDLDYYNLNANGEMAQFTLGELENYTKQHVQNLETATDTIAYVRKAASESLIANCTVTTGGMYDEGSIYYYYFPDIEILPGHKLRIGVYKEVGQSTKSCTKETVGKYEKIRDDIVDLNTF